MATTAHVNPPRPHYGTTIYSAVLDSYTSEDGHRRDFKVSTFSQEELDDIVKLWETNPRLLASIVYSVESA